MRCTHTFVVCGTVCMHLYVHTYIRTFLSSPCSQVLYVPWCGVVGRGGEGRGGGGLGYVEGRPIVSLPNGCHWEMSRM